MLILAAIDFKNSFVTLDLTHCHCSTTKREMLRILCINFGNPQPWAKEFWTNSLSYSRSHPLDKLVVGEYHDISLMCETALDTIVHESTALSYTTVKYHVTHSSQSDRNIIY